MAVEREETIHVEAPPDRVWVVYADVEKWPEWTPAMQRIERLEDGPLALGSTARIQAKGSPDSVWTVTELTEGRSFTWESTARGVKVVAWHLIEADNAGSKVTLGVRMSGLMAMIFSPFLRSLQKRNLALEAEGLKRRCEEQEAAS
jgi:uncharacterized membrane protein